MLFHDINCNSSQELASESGYSYQADQLGDQLFLFMTYFNIKMAEPNLN